MSLRSESQVREGLALLAMRQPRAAEMESRAYNDNAGSARNATSSEVNLQIQQEYRIMRFLAACTAI